MVVDDEPGTVVVVTGVSAPDVVVVVVDSAFEVQAAAASPNARRRATVRTAIEERSTSGSVPGLG